MKKYIILIIFLNIIFLTGCNRKLKISFEDFSFKFDSTLKYTNITDDLWLPIILGYNSETTWNASNLLIMKYKNEQQTLNEVFAYNTQNIDSEEQNTQNFLFSCNKENIDSIMSEFTMDKNWEILYFIQDFYIYNDNVYIISFGSNNQTERTNFIKALGEINCK